MVEKERWWHWNLRTVCVLVVPPFVVLYIVICIRRNWKDRFFVLKQDKTLCYYDTSDYHSAKPQKTIELSQVINLIDGGSKEHAFGIETSERTYHCTAASSEEKR